MKTNEVPQDQDPAFEGGKKLCYALGEDGRYVTAQSSGWQVEATVKELAWQVLRADLEATRVRVGTGEASALEYFMKLRQMDTWLLAQNMGISRLRVRWHLRPRRFATLNAKWLARYAECLAVDVAVLRGFRGEREW